MVLPIHVAHALGKPGILKVVGIEGLGELIYMEAEEHWPGIKLMT